MLRAPVKLRRHSRHGPDKNVEEERDESQKKLPGMAMG
jgi:hypothetical protein